MKVKIVSLDPPTIQIDSDDEAERLFLEQLAKVERKPVIDSYQVGQYRGCKAVKIAAVTRVKKVQVK